MEKWQQIERAAEKLQELLRGFDIDMGWAIDCVRGHPRATRPPTQDEVLEEMSVDPKLAVALEVCRNANSLYPSRQAKDEVDGIKETLSTLVAVAQNGISRDRERKDSKRKHDPYRDLLIVGLASLYEETFRKKASTRREGSWPTFLARVLGVLEDKETTPDAAYEAWLQVKKRLKDLA